MKRNKPPEPISSILKSTLKGLNLEHPLKKYSVWNHWEEIVGRGVAQKAQPAHVLGDTLVVEVSSHPWMTELTLMKNMILEKIQQKIEGCPLKNIRFELSKNAPRLKPKR
ncbi:MAG: DUF721 domain-containing protein [bacterium]